MNHLTTILIIFCTLALVLHTQRRVQTRPNIAGFFYACNLNIGGSVPPCVSIMDALPLRCKTAGKAEPFFLACNINFSVMSYTENECSCTCKSCAATKSSNVNEILEELFTAYGPEDISETLWSWFVIAMCSPDFEEWQPNGRLNLANFYEILTGLIKQLEIIHLKIN